jgi:hypothetical protein
MRNRIFGAIGVIWGGAILVFGFMKGDPEGNGAYAQGQGVGLLFGAALFAVGLYYLIKGKKSDGPGR